MTNLSMDWIDYTKAYDMVPHPWMVGAAKNMISIISNCFVNWKTVLTSGGDWSGCHQRRHLSRRLSVTLVVYSSHAATDTSAAKDKSWVQNGEGHEIQRPSIVHG